MSRSQIYECEALGDKWVDPRLLQEDRIETRRIIWVNRAFSRALSVEMIKSLEPDLGHRDALAAKEERSFQDFRTKKELPGVLAGSS